MTRNKVRISIVGASGYAGGELLRLLLFHPHVNIVQATSERFARKPLHVAHPNLRGLSNLLFCPTSELQECDVLFLCLPHGRAMKKIVDYQALAPRIIDLSSDFRLRDAQIYEQVYGDEHTAPNLLEKFVYGIPELHREEMRDANYISSAGCNATAVILALHPLKDMIDNVVVEIKAGSSQSGNKSSDASHHPERSGCVRTYKATGHRHTAEMVQELGFPVHFSATSIEMVRGIHATCHVFLKENLDEKTVWKLYRQAYGNEPFIRIVKERRGIFRFPEPKLLSGTNYCDIGFEKDAGTNRLVVISAIDNLVKGAAGQAIQAFNIMHGFNETLSLEFAGLHP